MKLCQVMGMKWRKWAGGVDAVAICATYKAIFILAACVSVCFFVPSARDDVSVRRTPVSRAPGQAVLIGAEDLPAKEQEAVVPHYQVARSPVVAVDEFGPGCVFGQFVEQRPAFASSIPSLPTMVVGAR